MAQAKHLSPADRLELIGALWRTLSPHETALTDEEKSLLDARIADAKLNPDAQSPWSVVRKRLRQQLP